ncbi:hypothetical protein LX16_1599 [Stackebrandtia albiflava]|uniref:Uncharacterized protein n=1 Tax=Stackebrandtia albiflava TaxID=406432 RepID=A0A562VDD1_9ACTN|nr:hypothetical protein [Stackebrandtia albiflava]TWJ15880.1 hypothetical protein LX16_1599 [Stackebrandtia albiflava]
MDRPRRTAPPPLYRTLPGFAAPAAPDFTAERDRLATDWTTTNGKDIRQPGIANLSTAYVTYRRQRDRHATAQWRTDRTEVHISGNPHAHGNPRRRLYTGGVKFSSRPPDRIDCSEPKVFSEVRRALGILRIQPGAPATPVVYLHTEHGPCRDCRKALIALIRDHTWVDFTLVWRRWFQDDYDGAPDNWKGPDVHTGRRLTWRHTTELADNGWPAPVARAEPGRGRPDPTANPFDALRDLPPD